MILYDTKRFLLQCESGDTFDGMKTDPSDRVFNLYTYTTGRP